MDNMSDKEVIAHALQMWANHIQTGNVCLTPGDLNNMRRSSEIRALDTHQMKFLVRLEDLRERVLALDVL